MNNNSNNPDEPKRKRKPHTGDKKRFTPSPMGYKWHLVNKFPLDELLRENLLKYRYSLYQGGILYTLHQNNKRNSTDFMSKRQLISSLQVHFSKIEKPKNVIDKSVESAISKLHKTKKIYGTLVSDDSKYGKITVMGYHIDAQLTEEMKKQIRIFFKLMQKDPNAFKA